MELGGGKVYEPSFAPGFRHILSFQVFTKKVEEAKLVERPYVPYY